jgi:plastocyanin
MKTLYTFQFIILALFFSVTADVASAARYSIDVRNYSFSPSSLTNVQIGDTIHWEWKEGSHTTTSAAIPSGAASWDRPLTSSQQTYDYIPTVAGTYNYVCTPHASMGMVGSFVVAPLPTSVAANASTLHLVISPNPFTDKVTVQFSTNDQRSIESLRIYDITGKFLAEQTFEPGQTNTQREILLSGLTSGLFLFEFRDNLGNIYPRRVVKK